MPFLCSLFGLDHSRRIELGPLLWQCTFSGGPEGTGKEKDEKLICGKLNFV